MDLFTLAAKLTLDSSSFDSGVTKASNAGEKLKKGLDRVKKIAVTVAGAAVLGKLTSSVKKYADQAAAAGDKIDKQSQALGISRKAYQEWDYILSQSGSSIDSLGTSMKTLNNAILGGNDSIEKLGLSFDDLNTMSMEEQFEAVVKAFQEMPEGAEKSALAVELFGKNGQQLLPLLNSTSDSVDALKQQFADLGIAMSDEQIDAAVGYTDAMDTLQRTFEAIGIAIGSEFLPMLTEWAQGIASFVGSLLAAYKENGFEGLFTELSNQIDGFITSLQDSGNPVLEKLGDVLVIIKGALDVIVGLFTDFDTTVKELKSSDILPLQLLGIILGTIKSVFDWLVTNSGGVVEAIGLIIGAFTIIELAAFLANLNPIIAALTAFALAAALIIANWSDIATWFDENVWQPIVNFFTPMWDEIKKLWEGTKEAISNAWTTIANWFDTTVWTPIKTFFETMWDTVKKLWTGVKEAISGAWATIATWFDTTVWTPIKEFFETMWDAVKAFWDDPLGAITEAWSAVSGWVKQNVTDPIVGFFKGIITTVQNAINKVRELAGLSGSGVSQEAKDYYTDLGERAGSGDTAAIDEFLRAPADALKNFVGGNSSPITSTGEMVTRNHRQSTQIPGHAKGLWDVPYDDYLARLHRGETVLSASQARQYREGEGQGAVVSAIQGLRNDLNNLKLMVGEKVFGEAVVDYGGRRLSEYIGGAESQTAYGYGT